ncbi:MAG TPA: hypothetical protein VFE97_06620 [Methylomirabilota bacterium]|nr:hypothetical protein [Methylomirabilota bacterium]
MVFAPLVMLREFDIVDLPVHAHGNVPMPVEQSSHVNTDLRGAAPVALLPG